MLKIIFSNRYSMNLKNVNINYLVYFTIQLQEEIRFCDIGL